MISPDDLDDIFDNLQHGTTKLQKLCIDNDMSPADFTCAACILLGQIISQSPGNKERMFESIVKLIAKGREIYEAD